MKQHRIKILYIGLFALLVFTFWPSNDPEQTSSVYQWNVKTDPQGGVEIFGVKLGHHTLLEAENILKAHSERALFIQSDDAAQKHPDIEAFFAQMPDNSKLILGLAADEATIRQIKSRAHKPLAFPSGSIRLDIAQADMATVEKLKVKMLTYVPRIKLTPSDLKKRFGEPSQVIKINEVYHFLYPKIGLDAILDNSGKGIIQFVAPNQFQAVQEKLKAGTPVQPGRAP